MKFQATLQLHGKTATGLEVPADVVTALGSSKRPAVQVTINGYTYRSTIGPRNGSYMLPVSAEHRTAARIVAGDKITVEVVIDNEPREVNVPTDFTEALNNNMAAKTAFDKMSYSHQLQHVLAIDGAKTPATRQRRIDKAIEMLAGGN
ncbi:DUF1905 domain-containing protein [Segetibacter sp. 3557_3]|uniref:YdeI/OmpD-associated family protein n=1 Tax=Segetibacter sp. 3557_3 TaxID=2547429 RepID=UPI001058A3AD|nr:YdeI/OmpD-associated family protein [Segetibacter sp. 3557_3]TDH21262.1 DUF1905 domain-containing protein [Segetibacter sp. 3557_3]